MTLLGKVFTVLIFVFSVVFFCFSLAVNASHNNWRDAVIDPNKGFQAQVNRLKAGNQQLNESLQKALSEMAAEQAARRASLAALQTQLDAISEQLAQKTTELAGMQATNTQLSQTLSATQTELQRVTNENVAVKQQLDATVDDRNQSQRKVATLTDEVNSKRVLVETLQKKEKDMTERETLLEARLDNALNALASAGISETPDDAPPRDLRGVVTAVGQNGLIEISLGRDDGLREGHQLEVYRGSQYLGRIEIRRTQDDKAIGQILPNFRKGYIQQGDNVSSKLG